MRPESGFYRKPFVNTNFDVADAAGVISSLQIFVDLCQQISSIWILIHIDINAILTLQKLKSSTAKGNYVRLFLLRHSLLLMSSQ